MYLLNRLPTKAMDSRTPFEAWYGKNHMSDKYSEGYVATSCETSLR